MESNRNIDRKIDLSGKFLIMGQSLLKEGETKEDPSIINAGNLFIMMSTLIVNDDDMAEFIYLMTLFTAKKRLDYMDSISSSFNEVNNMFKDLMDKLSKKKDGDSEGEEGENKK